MKELITDIQKDPLGAMLQDYIDGDKLASVNVTSANLDMWEMTGDIMFRSFKQMSHIEKKALSMCKGKILDVGAGSGCHSLYLQKRHPHVDALDISPGCHHVMHQRKIKNPIHNNLFSLGNNTYDTVLMLMNGIGICGSIDGLNLFFQFIRTILSKTGQIIADSTDLATLYNLEKIVLDDDIYYGETQFTMRYQSQDNMPAKISDPFDWLYIDFDTLKFHARFHGFSCEKIMTDQSFRYLVRLSPY